MNADENALRIFNQIVHGRAAERNAASALLGDPAQEINRQLLRQRILDAVGGKFAPGQEELEQDDSIRWTRSWLVNTLGKICDGDAQAAAAVRRHLDPVYEQAYWVRFWAFESLIGTGAADLPELARRVSDDGEPLMRMQALTLLATRGTPEEQRRARREIEAALVAEVNPGPDGRVELEEVKRAEGLKWAALRALRVVPIASMFGPIQEIVSRGRNDDVTYDAIIALSAAPPGSPHADRAALALSEFVTRFRAHPWYDGMRTASLKALGRLKVESAAPLLVEELADENPAVAREAALALKGVVGIRTAAARVVEAASKADPARAEALARALRWMERDAVVEELESVMVSGRPEHQEAARHLLSEMGGLAAMQKLRARTASIAQYSAEMEKAEEKVRNLFESTIDEARKGFRAAAWMDVIVFAAGLVLIVASAFTVLFREGSLNNWVGVGAAGATGVAGILYSLFVAKPRRQILEAVDHLMHIKLVFLAYLRQLHQVDQAYTRRLLEDRPLASDEAGQYSAMVEATMCNAVEQMFAMKDRGGRPAPARALERAAAAGAAGNGKVKAEGVGVG